MTLWTSLRRWAGCRPRETNHPNGQPHWTPATRGRIISGMAVLIVIVLAVAAGFALLALSRDQPAYTPEQRAQAAAAKQRAALDAQERRLATQHGTVNPQLVCPHCQTLGKVRTQAVKVKQGISGGKATGALLTGGISLVATGLSRKVPTTQARCGNCTSVWAF